MLFSLSSEEVYGQGRKARVPVGRGFAGGTGEQTSNLRSAIDLLATSRPDDVQSIAIAQLQLTTAYYEGVLSQASKSFTLALFASILGLLLLLGSILFVVLGGNASLATISVVSGALVETIAGLNFYLQGRTSAQLSTFHLRLDRIQRFLLANSLLERLHDEQAQKTRADLVRAIASSDELKAEH